MNTKERLFDRIKMLPGQTVKEEIASSIIHGIGILISIASLVLLVVFASLAHNVTQVVSFSIFGGFSVYYFLCSTFHHSLTHYRAKRVFRIMEQTSVYLFIIGAAMPVSFLLLPSTWGWIFFSIVTVMGVIGILNLFFNIKSSGDVDFTLNVLFLLFIIGSLIFSLKFFYPQFKVFFLPGSFLFLCSFIIASMNGLKYNQAYAHALSLAATVLYFFAFFDLIAV